MYTTSKTTRSKHNYEVYYWTKYPKVLYEYACVRHTGCVYSSLALIMKSLKMVCDKYALNALCTVNSDVQ